MTGIPASWLLAELVRALAARASLGELRVDRILLAAPLEPDGADVVGRTAWRQAMRCGPVEPARGIADVPPVETFDVPDGPASTGQGLVHRAVRLVDSGECDLVLVAGAASSRVVSDGGPPWCPVPPAAADLLATRWGLARGELDEYATRSRRRAAEVAAMGEFRPEIVPVRHPAGDRQDVITEDELSDDAHVAEPEWEPARLVTEHNSCRAAAGAAAVLIAGTRFATRHGIGGRGRVVALADSVADAGDDTAAGPVLATRAVLAESGLGIDDMDHYEISETCAPVTLAWQRRFQAGMDRFNPRGGAIALGRLAGGASIRSMITMLRALEDTGGTFGLQVMDDAGGRTKAMVVERGCGRFGPARQGSSR